MRGLSLLVMKESWAEAKAPRGDPPPGAVRRGRPGKKGHCLSDVHLSVLGAGSSQTAPYRSTAAAPPGGEAPGQALSPPLAWAHPWGVSHRGHNLSLQGGDLRDGPALGPPPPGTRELQTREKTVPGRGWRGGNELEDTPPCSQGLRGWVGDGLHKIHERVRDLA